jgi:hypothetical protein
MAQQAVMAQRTVSSPPMLNARGLGNILWDEYFKYSITFTFTTGAENFQQVIPIQSDAHFIAMASSYTNSHEVGTTAGAGIGYPYVNIWNGGAVVQITDGGNQHFLSNIQVPVNCLFGTGQLPHVWEFTHLFRANTPLAINITGMGAAAPFAGQVIQLVFYGMKIPLSHAQQIGL